MSATQQKLADQLFEEIWPSEELWEIGDWEDHHWQTVVEQQWRLVAANRRWKATSQALITDFRAGRIKTFSRDREGGSLKPVEPHDWNFENWHRRMIEFDIDPSDPFETESESSRMDVRTLRYLYVDREDIDRLAGSWSADMPTPAQWAALSPYLHFAVAAATTIGAGILKTGTRKDIVARLNALNVPKPPHGTEAHKADEIASVIRFPESEKAGRRPIKKTP